MIFHRCPVHGQEECLMGSDARQHSCRELPFLFAGETYEREIAVIAYLKRVIAE